MTGTSPPRPELAGFTRQMYTRFFVDRLPAHLEERYGVQVSGVSELDLGGYRVSLGDGAGWVARLFPAARPAAETQADAEILRFVSGCDFPAERCAAAEPVSVLDGQAVLVTQYVDGARRLTRVTTPAYPASSGAPPPMFVRVNLKSGRTGHARHYRRDPFHHRVPA